MKRLFKGLIFALIAVLSFTLISCGNTETPHEHTPNAAWKRDSSGHWHECDGCDQLLDFTLHTMSDWTKVENECKEKSECSVCGYATTRTKSHEFVDGVCTGCGLDEGNYEVAQFYVRGTINSWGSPDEYALVYDNSTKTASIQVTLPADAQFKVADASWSDGLNFGFNNVTFEEGLFDNNDGDNIHVITAADYIVTVSGFDTGVYSVEIKIACRHEFDPKQPVSGKQCHFTETCKLCGVVNPIVQHTFTDADIICDVCGYADLKTYYVKGSFNNFSVNPEFALEYNATNHTATVDLWLQVGHSFKIGTDGGDAEWRFSYDNVTFTEKAKDAFIADNDRNIYCVAKGADAMGVKFTVTISGLNTLNHTMTIDTQEEYSVESVNLPTASGWFLKGSMNDWSTVDSYGLTTKDGKSVITLTFAAGDSFQIAKADTWDGALGFNKLTDKTGFEATGDYGNDIKVLTAGTYTIIVYNNALTIVAGEGDDVELPTVDPVDETALYLKGTMNSWSPKADYKFTKDGETYTLEVELAANDKFKVFVGSGWDPEWNFNNITTGADLFTADTEDPNKPNIIVKAAGVYTITINGTNVTVALKVEDEPTVNPDEPTQEPDEPTVNPDEPTQEPDEPTVNPDEPTQGETPDTPTVQKSDFHVLSNNIGWESKDDYALLIGDGEFYITVKLLAGDEFKVRKGETWEDELYGYSQSLDSTLFENGENGNAKVKVSALYKIVVKNNSMTVTKVGEYPCVSSETHTMVDATCTEAKHCSVTGCGYVEGAALGHDWDEGVVAENVKTYTCQRQDCEATKQENIPAEGEEEPTPVKSDLRLVGINGVWDDVDANALYTVNDVHSITVKINAGEKFKVKKVGTWDVQYHYLNGQNLDTTLFEADTEDQSKPNIIVKVAGTYKISISGTTLSVEKVGEYTCVSGDTHTMVEASCLVSNHCSVTGCAYVAGPALGHDWNDGVVSGNVKTYTCQRQGCEATKEEAVAGFTIYLKPNSNWTQANARFAVYLFEGNNNLWLDMHDTDGDGVYEVVLTEAQLSTYSNIIFCRMNPGTTENNWNNKWNQSADLKIQSTSGQMYTVQANTWDKGNGSWSAK